MCSRRCFQIWMRHDTAERFFKAEDTTVNYIIEMQDSVFCGAEPRGRFSLMWLGCGGHTEVGWCLESSGNGVSHLC